jgi:uncharacterized damage-inducible protein DinB
MMTIGQTMLAELEYEALSTRNHLAAIPADKLDWQPHAKSSKLGPLARHLAEIPGWTKETMTRTVLDFDEENFQPVEIKSAGDAIALLDQGMATAREILSTIKDEEFFVEWSMKAGGAELLRMPRIQVMRGFILSHIVHHRAQLGVYLRLLDIPVPKAYGPTADDASFS